jgi:HK97 family phage major capsid protein
VDNLKKLQDEAALLANRIDAVRAVEGDADQIAARDLELESLTADAAKLAKKIEFEKSVLESAKNLRSVVDRCTPAPEVRADEPKVRIESVPFHGKLRAFKSEEDAYKAGMWIKGYLRGDAEARRWCNDAGVEARAQGSTGSTTGSAFVPDILSNQVLRLVNEDSVFASNATPVNMPSDVVLVPKRTGGATAYWVAENTAITDSDPTHSQITLTAKKVTAATRVSSELFEDSVVGIAEMLATELSYTLTQAVESVAFNGNSANAPNIAGILTSGGILKTTTSGQTTTNDYDASIVAAAGDTFDEITKANLVTMLGSMPSHSRQGAAWVVSPYAFATCFQALDLNQGGSVGLSQGMGLTFMGYPVLLSHQMVGAGDQTGKAMVLFANLRNAAHFGVRRGLEIASSDQVAFLSDQVVVRATMRCAISWSELGSDTVAGPVIALKGA